MKKRSNVEIVLSTPKVPYKETVTALGEGHYKHKKQSGGRGQYGEVYLRVEPLKAGETEWFEDALVGSAIPRNFLPAIQKGLRGGHDARAPGGLPRDQHQGDRLRRFLPRSGLLGNRVQDRRRRARSRTA